MRTTARIYVGTTFENHVLPTRIRDSINSFSEGNQFLPSNPIVFQIIEDDLQTINIYLPIHGSLIYTYVQTDINMQIRQYIQNAITHANSISLASRVDPSKGSSIPIPVEVINDIPLKEIMGYVGDSKALGIFGTLILVGIMYANIENEIASSRNYNQRNNSHFFELPVTDLERMGYLYNSPLLHHGKDEYRHIRLLILSLSQYMNQTLLLEDRNSMMSRLNAINTFLQRNNASASNFTWNIIEGSELQENFPLTHAVGAAAISAPGGARSPQVLEMNWRGNPSSDKIDYTLIGKNVWHDSGGINQKQKSYGMSQDDQGGVIAFNTLFYAAATNARCNVRVFLPCVYNITNPDCLLPGEILTLTNGMTLGINNTDAEGRILISDILSHIRDNPGSNILILATLTAADTYLRAYPLNNSSFNSQFVNELDHSFINFGTPCEFVPQFQHYDYVSVLTTEGHLWNVPRHEFRSTVMNYHGPSSGRVVGPLFTRIIETMPNNPNTVWINISPDTPSPAIFTPIANYIVTQNHEQK